MNHWAYTTVVSVIAATTALLIASALAPDPKAYACKVDSFYGIAECFQIVDDEECNDDRNRILVLTPFATDWEQDDTGEYVEVPAERPYLCVERDDYTLTTGTAAIEGFEI